MVFSNRIFLKYIFSSSKHRDCKNEGSFYIFRLYLIGVEVGVKEATWRPGSLEEGSRLPSNVCTKHWKFLRHR